MSEATQCRVMALWLLIAAVIVSIAFVSCGFHPLLMLGAAALLVGAFMAFLLSFAA